MIPKALLVTRVRIDLGLVGWIWKCECGGHGRALTVRGVERAADVHEIVCTLTAPRRLAQIDRELGLRG